MSQLHRQTWSDKVIAPRHEQAAALDGALADLLDLSLVATHAHWNVVGPRFSALHALLDDLAALARESADGIAERSATLGHPPDGRAATITTLSSLPSVGAAMLHNGEVITAFGAILDKVADRLHSALEAFDDDCVSLNLFTSILAGVERFAWMLRAQSDR
jgi:starvation-inducible DNA-binding protein